MGVLDTLGALALLAWTVAMWVAVAVLVHANRKPVRPWVFRAAAVLIAVGVLGQLGYVQEHVAQAGYWFGHPDTQGWATPWGAALAGGFGQVDRSAPSLGMEVLQFTGSLLVLAGLAGVVVITHHAILSRARRWARIGLWLQGLHVLEHLALTLSVWLGAPRAIGFSTWFGLVDPGPGLWTYRVWWHAAASVAGAVVAGIALYHLWRERRRIAVVYTGPVQRILQYLNAAA